MTKKLKTKHTFILSCLSLLMCVALFIGSTFAWFTDSKTAGINIIQSGKFKIDILNDEDESMINKTLKFVKAEGAEDEPIIWEPGCTYNLQNVYIENQGNLSIKYKIIISGIDGSNKLNDVLNWQINGEDINQEKEYILNANSKSDAIVLSAHMNEDAGNDYQDLTITNISITVIASQNTYESDSIDNTYDADATYPTVLNDVSEIDGAFADAKSGDTIILSDKIKPIDNENISITVPEGIDKLTIKSIGAQIDSIKIDNPINELTLEGIDITRSSTDGANLIINAEVDKLTIKNSIISDTFKYIQNGNSNTDLVIDNCEFINISYPIYDAWKGYNNVTVTNSTFTNITSWCVMIQGNFGGTLTIDNCSFDNCCRVAKCVGFDENAKIIFTNNTMNNCTPREEQGVFIEKSSKQNSSNITISNNTFTATDDSKLIKSN